MTFDPKLPVILDALPESLIEIEILFDKMFADNFPVPMYKIIMKQLFRMHYRWLLKLVEDPQDYKEHIKNILFSPYSMLDLLVETDRPEFANELRDFLKNYTIPERAFK